MKLNEKIYVCRRKAGLSQEALAEKVGVSRQAISKWETGTAVPELDNIVTLSEVFGVTTDWLIKDNKEDTDSETDDAPSQDTEQQSEETHQSESVNDAWFESRLPFFKRFIKRFGWLAGVYIAVCSAGLTALGVIAKVIVSAMISGFSKAGDSVINSFGGFGSSAPEIVVEGDIPDEVLAQIQQKFAGEYGSGVFDSFQSSSDAMLDTFASSNPVSIAANIMIFIGIIGIIAGVIIALWLKSKGNTEE